MGALEKFRFCIFSLNFISPVQAFNILTLHLNLTIFSIGNMHLGQTISNIKVDQAKRGHVAHENGVYMYNPL